MYLRKKLEMINMIARAETHFKAKWERQCGVKDVDLACRPLRLKSHPYHLPAVSPRASHMTSQCPSFLVCIIGEQRPTEKGLKFSGSQELRTSALEPTLQPTLCYSCGTWERLFNFFPA